MLKKIQIYILLLLISLPFLNCKGQKNIQSNLDEKIGQMLLIGFKGFSINDKSPIVKDIVKYKIGSVILFDYDIESKSYNRNIQSASQVKKLSKELQSFSGFPLFIAIDQEGGLVSRLKEKYGFPASVTAQYLGELNNIDSTQHYANITAKTLKSIGVNLNFAPVVDLNINPDNPAIGKVKRSYSSDPKIVSIHASEVIKQHHKYKITTAIKHFPGHGSAWNDSHFGIAEVTKTWQKTELNPYQNIIDSGISDFIMTAHIFNSKLDSIYPATLSKTILTGLLRKKMNFQGVIISDDMQMKAISSQYGLEQSIKQAINAGVDILLFGNNLVYDEKIAEKAINIIKKLIKNGEISSVRIDESYKRIMKLKKKYL